MVIAPELKLRSNIRLVMKGLKTGAQRANSIFRFRVTLAFRSSRNSPLYKTILRTKLLYVVNLSVSACMEAEAENVLILPKVCRCSALSAGSRQR